MSLTARTVPDCQLGRVARFGAISCGGPPASNLLPLNAPAEILIGSTHGDHLRIRVLRRLYPSACDYWDGNWLDTPIEVAAGRFRADINANLRADELAAFGASLQRLHESLTGEALLESMEEWIRLTVTIDRTGQLRVTGDVPNQAGVGRLTFSLGDFDQSHVPPVLDALRIVGSAFPVVGRHA